MCLTAIYWARMKAVYFGASQKDAARAGFDDAFLYGEVSKPLADRVIPAVQMLPEEAWAAFSAWVESETKVEY
jgi:tRNA(Arg) A34 adenosine deaminase TadA